jgi:hypothetical protein
MHKIKPFFGNIKCTVPGERQKQYLLALRAAVAVPVISNGFKY